MNEIRGLGWCGIVGVVLSLYIGTYYTAVSPAVFSCQSAAPLYFVPDGTKPSFEVFHSGRGWRLFFAPIHWFDRRLRAEYWAQ